MEHVDGIQLQQRWPNMTGSQYTKCVQSVCMTMKQLAALDFPAYGSPYFDNAPFDWTLKTSLGDGYCIGPYCATAYWDRTSGQIKGVVPTSDKGPWPNLRTYAAGLVTNGYSKLSSSGIAHSRPSYFGTVHEHRSLLSIAQNILQSLVQEPQIYNAAAPTLLHSDLHARNIYVSDEDPTTITCVIDWQSSSIEPAFIYAYEVPEFATAPSRSLSDETERAHTHEHPLTDQEKKLEKVASYCSQAYDICTKSFIPKLRIARSVDQLLVRPFQYSHTSWRDSATALRQEFLDLADQWEEMGLAAPCPYRPTTEELRLHRNEYRAFEHVQEIKAMLMKLLGTDSDGWVSIDRWEEVRRAHKDIFDLAFKTAREGGGESGVDSLSEDDIKELWPFDG